MSGGIGGAFDGPCHHFPVRVYFEDTDAGGIVYHASYLRFAERARTECMRALGWPYQRLTAETGCGWAVRRLDIDYLRPALLDDLVDVATRLTGQTGARLLAEQSIGRNGAVLARVLVTVVLVGANGRPVRLPDALRHSLAPMLSEA